jgi:hypothetical protein
LLSDYLGFPKQLSLKSKIAPLAVHDFYLSRSRRLTLMAQAWLELANKHSPREHVPRISAHCDCRRQGTISYRAVANNSKYFVFR